jgi:hypothetical protein
VRWRVEVRGGDIPICLRIPSTVGSFKETVQTSQAFSLDPILAGTGSALEKSLDIIVR